MPFAEPKLNLFHRHYHRPLVGGIVFLLFLGGLALPWRGPDVGYYNTTYYIYSSWAFFNNRLSVDYTPLNFKLIFSLIGLPDYAFKCFPINESTETINTNFRTCRLYREEYTNSTILNPSEK